MLHSSRKTARPKLGATKLDQEGTRMLQARCHNVRVATGSVPVITKSSCWGDVLVGDKKAGLPELNSSGDNLQPP